MSDHLCANCRHWIPPKVQPPDEYDVDTGPTHGFCKRVPHDPKAVVHWQSEDLKDWLTLKDLQEAHAMKAQLAVLHDGSGYKAELRTRAEFGCVLWARRDTDEGETDG